MKKINRIAVTLLTLGTLAMLIVGCEGNNPEPAKNAGANIILENVTESTIEVTIKPNEYTVSFTYAIGYAEDEAAFTDGTLEYIQESESGEQLTVSFDGLEPETSYVVFVLSKSESGASKLNKLAVTTEDIGALANVRVELVSAYQLQLTVRITPEENAVTYKYAIGRASDLNAFKDGTLKGIEESRNERPGNYQFADLKANTEYTVFAAGINEKGYMGEVATLIVNTTKSDTYVQVSVGENMESFFGELVSNAVIDNVSIYYILAFSKADYNGLLNYYSQNYGMSEVDLIEGAGEMLYAEGGVSFHTTLSGTPDEEQVAAIAAYDEYAVLLGVQYVYFMNMSYDPSLPLPADNALSTEITIVNSKNIQLAINIVVPDNVSGFYALLQTEAWYNELMGSSKTDAEKREAIINSMMTSNTGISSLEDYSASWQGFSPGEAYIVATTPFNANGTKGFGKMNVTVFTMPESAPGINSTSIGVPTLKSATDLRYGGLRRIKL